MDVFCNFRDDFLRFSKENSFKIKEHEKEFTLSFKACNAKVTDNSFVIYEGMAATEDTPVFTEGFQMLSVMGGTFKRPVNFSRCPDDEEPYSHTLKSGTTASCNFICMKPDDRWILFGASTSQRQVLHFKIHKDGYLCALLESGSLKDKDTVTTESLVILEADSLSDVLAQFTSIIHTHYPKKLLEPKSGWCSWYCYYENISEAVIRRNAQMMQEHDELSYIMIDDGYQTHMGDWLSFSDKFPEGIENLINEIRQNGKKAAIWVAPFIASEKSELFKNHPEYFIKNEDGKPLDSASVTYGGWRDTPWFMLDFGIKEVRDYIAKVFKTFVRMGVDLFKLDACYWGAVPSVRTQSGLNRVENYRLGLKTIRDAVKDKAALIGCNAPMWPSLGLIDIMRVTDDVVRDEKRINELGRQLSARIYLGRELFTLDPDTLVLHDLYNQRTSKRAYDFLKALLVLASGSTFCGDEIAALSIEDKLLFKKLAALSKCSRQIKFSDSLSEFEIKAKGASEQTLYSYFNYSFEKSEQITVKENGYNFISGERIEKGEHTLPPFSALVVTVPKSMY